MLAPASIPSPTAGALLALAALGSTLLARALGLRGVAAWLAGSGYALSGALLAAADEDTARVAALLPWALLGVERLAVRALGGLTLVFAAASLAAFAGAAGANLFLVLAAGAWCVAVGRDARGAALVGLIALCVAQLAAVPFGGGVLASEAGANSVARTDWVALGALLVALGAWLRAREGERAAPLLVGLVVTALAAVLARRGLGPAPGAALRLEPLAELRPAAAVAWIAPTALALALAAALRRGTGPAAGPLVLAFATLGLGLAWDAPGIAEAWTRVPLVGSADPLAAAPVAALAVALAAGAGLRAATTRARRGAAFALVGCATLAAVGGAPRPLPAERVPLDTIGTVIELEEAPPAVADANALRLAGTVHEGVPLASAALHVVPLDARGEPAGAQLVVPLSLEVDPAGRHRFDSGPMDPAHLARGDHLFVLELDVASGGVERRVARTFVPPPPLARIAPLVPALATAALLWMTPSALANALLLLALVLQAAWVAVR